MAKQHAVQETVLELEARGVYFGYGKEKQVLRGVDVKFGCRKLNGILGPNGSGKTTLLKLLSGAQRPAAGSVTLGGREVAGYPARELARLMSVVPQSTRIDFEMTALDVALMGRQPYIKRFERESPQDIEIARGALERTDLLEYQDTPVTLLSGGEMQRVIIARALCQQAGVMLLDEPVSSLDIRHTAHVLKLLKELAEGSDVTVVCVLHDLSLAGCFCDNLALMHGGKLFAFGSPQEVLTADNILKVYGVEADIIRDSGGGIRVLPRYV